MMIALNGLMNPPIVVVMLATIIIVIVETEDVESTIAENATAIDAHVTVEPLLTIIVAVSIRGDAAKPWGVRIQYLLSQQPHVNLIVKAIKEESRTRYRL